MAESDGYLMLGPYDEIQFTPQDDGSVEVFALLNSASQRIIIEQPNQATKPMPPSVTAPN